MDRTELTIVAAAALMVALGLGWVLRWVYSLLNPHPAPPPKADSEWAEYAKACEAQRDAAQARLAEVELDLGNKLTQAQAELSAAMEGLAAARRATEHLEGRLSSLDTSASSASVAAPVAPVRPEAPPAEEPVAPSQDAATPEPESAPAAEMRESTAEPTQAVESENVSDKTLTVTEPVETGFETDTPAADAPEAQVEENDQADPDAEEASPEDADDTQETTETQAAGSKRKRTGGKSKKSGGGTTSRSDTTADTGNGA